MPCCWPPRRERPGPAASRRSSLQATQDQGQVGLVSSRLVSSAGEVGGGCALQVCAPAPPGKPRLGVPASAASPGDQPNRHGGRGPGAPAVPLAPQRCRSGPCPHRATWPHLAPPCCRARHCEGQPGEVAQAAQGQRTGAWGPGDWVRQGRLPAHPGLLQVQVPAPHPRRVGQRALQASHEGVPLRMQPMRAWKALPPIATPSRCIGL